MDQTRNAHQKLSSWVAYSGIFGNAVV